MTPFRLSPEARRHIQDLWAFIARDSIDAAGRVRTEIRDACRRLAQHPYSAPPLQAFDLLLLLSGNPPRGAAFCPA